MKKILENKFYMKKTLSIHVCAWHINEWPCKFIQQDIGGFAKFG